MYKKYLFPLGLALALATGSHAKATSDIPKDTAPTAVSIPSLKADIRHHPILWILSPLATGAFTFLVAFYIPDTRIDVQTLIGFTQLTLLFAAVTLLVALVLASWRGLWRVQSAASEESDLPHFSSRCWRVFRFLGSLMLLSDVFFGLYLFELLDTIVSFKNLYASLGLYPMLVSLLIWLGVLAYDGYLGKGETEKSSTLSSGAA